MTGLVQAPGASAPVTSMAARVAGTKMDTATHETADRPGEWLGRAVEPAGSHFDEAWTGRFHTCEIEPEPGKHLTRDSIALAILGVVGVGAIGWVGTGGDPTPRELVVVLLALGSVLLAVAYGWLNARYPTKYRPALWSLAPLAPLVAIVASMGFALYYVEDGRVQAISLTAGAFVGLAVWILASWAVREIARADVANGRAFEQIELRLRQLAERIEDIATWGRTRPHGNGAVGIADRGATGAATRDGNGEAESPEAASAVAPADADVMAHHALANPAQARTLAALGPTGSSWADGAHAWRGVEGVDPLARAVALSEARAELVWVICNLRFPPHSVAGNCRSGFRWSTASGYVNCFRALHRAEEALTEVEPVGLLVGDGLHDYFSLRDSRIPNRDGLMAGVRKAIGRLDNTVAEDFFDSAESSGRQRGSKPEAGGSGATGSTTTTVTTTSTAEADHLHYVENDRAARAVLREVRFAINDFRDDAFDGLVRQRNRLWRTILTTGLVTYALLALAILARAPAEQLLVAGAFFLTGAIVGMFNQLRLAGSAKSAVEDFGLSEALLVQVPLVSGLAALAGVVVTGILSPAALATAGTDVTAPKLTDIFGRETFAGYLLVAALFGLSPALLVDRLRKETRELQNDIASSEPTRKDMRLTDTV